MILQAVSSGNRLCLPITSKVWSARSDRVTKVPASALRTMQLTQQHRHPVRERGEKRERMGKGERVRGDKICTPNLCDQQRQRR